MNRAIRKRFTVTEECYERIYQATDCKTQAELAKLLGVQQSSISDAKRRNSIPSDWLIALFLERRINPIWILTGKETRFLCSSKNEEGRTGLPQITHRKIEEYTSIELLQETIKRLESL